MARAILTQRGEDVILGGGSTTTPLQVVGTTSPGEVVTIIEGYIELDASFNQGGDTITLPGLATDYRYFFLGSQLALTNADQNQKLEPGEVIILIPLGPNGMAVGFRGDELNADDNEVRTLVVQSGDIFLGDQELERGDPGDLGRLQPGSSRTTLTSGADTVSANIIDAPPTFTPGGTSRVNTLDNDDEVTGIGVNATLNVTLVNEGEEGEDEEEAEPISIRPTLIDIPIININNQFEGEAVLDFGNSSGIVDINVFGLDGSAALILDNIQSLPPSMRISIRDTAAEDGSLSVLFDQDSLRAAYDEFNQTLLSLRLADTTLGELRIDNADNLLGLGVTDLELTVEEEVNVLRQMFMRELNTISASGSGNLTIGSDTQATSPNDGRVEALRFLDGLLGYEDTLERVDASGMTGSFDFTIGGEAGEPGPNGLQILGGSSDDVFRLYDGPGYDFLLGGGGTNRLQLHSSFTSGSVDEFQIIDLRSGHDADSASDVIEIDFDLFSGTQQIWIRSEGMQSGGEGFDIAPEGALFHLFNLSTDQAANIHLQHGTSGNNGIGSNFLLMGLIPNLPENRIRISWQDQIDGENRSSNIDPRYNFLVSAAQAEKLVLDDLDGESNSVIIDVRDPVLKEVALNGGQSGQFLNLDTANSFVPRQGLYGLDVLGGASDHGSGHTGRTATHIAQGDDFGLTVRLSFSVLDGDPYTGDIIVRYGQGAQSAQLGSGNDTLVFDAPNDTNAGLTSQDSADGGEGDDDTIAFEGDRRIILGPSEFQNVFGFETILLIGNELSPANPEGFDLGGNGRFNQFGENAYNLQLDNGLIERNGLTDGEVRRIHIRNDNDIEGPNTVGGNGGATIDAASLSGGFSFSYDGAEGVNSTADRFVFSDASLNGRAIIDGGAAALRDPMSGGAGNTNWDILEIRATGAGQGAQVTVGDLAGIINVGELQFTNGSGRSIEHFLALDNATIDSLVLAGHAASESSPEVLVVSVYDNDGGIVATRLTVDLGNYDAGQGEYIRFEGDGELVVMGLDAGDMDGLDFTGFSGIFSVAASPAAAPPLNAAEMAGPATDHVPEVRELAFEPAFDWRNGTIQPELV